MIEAAGGLPDEVDPNKSVDEPVRVGAIGKVGRVKGVMLMQTVSPGAPVLDSAILLHNYGRAAIFVNVRLRRRWSFLFCVMVAIVAFAGLRQICAKQA